MLSAHERQQVTTQLAAMVAPVTLHVYTQTFGCESCGETLRLVRELGELSPLVEVEEHNLVLDKEAAARDGVERAPTVVLASGEQRRVRFQGGPFGYEFASLLQALVLVSTGVSGLSTASQTLLAALRESVHVQVFSTPT
jgi:alkyl hydroperoxide reductase subunit AhpF